MSDGQVKRTMPRALISLLITLAIGAVWFYISLPAINLHNTSFYSFVFILLLVYILVSMIVMGIDTGKQEVHLRDYLSFAKNQCKIVVIVVVALAAIFVVGQILSAPIFRASAYHELLDVGSGDFATDIEPVSYDEIPMLDEASASVLGDRKLGELSDMVSQFEYCQRLHPDQLPGPSRAGGPPLITRISSNGLLTGARVCPPTWWWTW